MVLGLMSVLLVITALRTFYPDRTIYDESYYEPVIAEFIRLSGIREEDSRLLLARYYPPVEEKPGAALSLARQLRNEPPNAALFTLKQPGDGRSGSMADPGQEHGRMQRSTEAGSKGTAGKRTANKQAGNKQTADKQGGSEEVLRVNVQQAGLEELVRLPGIGPVTAGRIIAYRENNGPFRKTEDLLNVSGIGPVTLERIREFIIVDPDPDPEPIPVPDIDPEPIPEPARDPGP
ncbi:MAG: hypothetical protein EA363_09650 [Balneolaceae bacterium]|nr:MAG: hypothetical protein EA363_09650 [Balneolaceae bacterium]